MLPAALAATLLLLAGCGDGDKNAEGPGDDGAASVDLGDDAPKCSEVWIQGKVLPKDFAGCMDGDTLVDLTYTPCEDGKTQLRIHQTALGKDEFFSLTGEPIQTYSDEAKSAAYAKCRPSN